jgi:CubicO group peptidase (beta-lactamase class C family)
VRDPAGTLKEMIAKFGQLPLATQPGSEWRYSLSTNVLGYLVQVISGLSLDVFLRQRIFEPLGMTDTGFHVPAEKLDRLAALYGPADNGLKIADALWLTNTGFTTPATFFSGEGGLLSTTADYLRFSHMLLRNGELDGVRLLSRKTVELMTTNHLPNDLLPYRLLGTVQRGLGFGLGLSVVMDIGQTGLLGSVGTYSWGGAFNTHFWVDPKEDLIGISMTQYSIPLQPIRHEFQTLVYQAVID